MNVNQTSTNEKCIFSKKKNSRYMTINLSTNKKTNENIKIGKNLNEILKDIEIYRNQLYDTHGSIYIYINSSQTKQCYCNHKQSIEISKKISDFENEFYHNKFIEYVYNIENIKNKNNIIQ